MGKKIRIKVRERDLADLKSVQEEHRLKTGEKLRRSHALEMLIEEAFQARATAREEAFDAAQKVARPSR